MMETYIFSSHPFIQHTLKEAAQKATADMTKAFDAKVSQAMHPTPTPADVPTREQPPSSRSPSSPSPISESQTSDHAKQARKEGGGE
eukprot:3530609-Karenia_brevis.AAC.1